jgi:hypothetical protein
MADRGSKLAYHWFVHLARAMVAFRTAFERLQAALAEEVETKIPAFAKSVTCKDVGR